jgi:hypothetical protein
METSTAVKVALPLKVAKQLASLAVFAETKKGTTPALQVVRLTFTAGSVSGVATDRYCIAKATFTTDSTDEGVMYLDQAGAKWITGLVAKPAAMVEFATGQNGLELSYQQFSDYLSMHYCERYSANYPAVETLFDGLEVGGVERLSLNVSMLAKLAKLIGDEGKKLDSTWEFTYHTGPNPNRPNPILAKNSAYQVWIQPALLSR